MPAQPQFPDYYTNYQQTVAIPAAQAAALKAAQADCEAQGGVFSSNGCYIPPPPPPPVISPQISSGGNCSAWLAAAGVTDIYDAMLVINAESGCNPWARNPSSGACGVAQELPCGKSGCAYGNGACEVAWMAQTYIPSSYGTWANAAYHERAYGWY